MYTPITMKTTKYPKTHYLPWAKPATHDRRIADMSKFEGQRVIMTEKMDGENTTMYRSKIHARSLDSVNHPSRNWVKNYWSTLQFNIPHDIRICGENCYAKHSIHYTELDSYFYGFSAWRENMCLSWDETLAIFAELGIVPVNVLYDGIYDKDMIGQYRWNMRKMEGYVLRIADEFPLSEFELSIGKHVRDGHIETDEHWMRKPIVPNILGTISL